ncbi:MAG: hypothetical protein ACOX7F_01125 [Eubacteriales bacterium]|jgi:hypothetical protein
MSFLTTTDGQGVHSAAEPQLILERLARYETMHRALLEEYQSICQRLEQSRSAGKGRTVTHQQLLASKLSLQAMITRLELYDL